MAQVLETPEASSIADGVTASFTIPFTFAARAEVQVTVETAAGVRTLQVLNTDYTIPDGDWLETGGNVVFISGRLPPDDSYVERRRVTPAEQPQAFGDQEVFRPVANESAFDKQTRLAAEAKAALNRAMTTPVNEAGLKLPRASLRRGKVLGFADSDEALPVMVPNTAVAVAEDVAAAQAAAGTATAQASTATTQAGIATTQAGIATTKAAEAEVARAAAVVARTGAEASAAAALAAGQWYDSEAAGRAAVADGERFLVLATDGLRLFSRTNSTTSVAVNVGGVQFTVPSKAGIGQLGPRIRLEIIAGAAEAASPARDPARQFIARIVDPLVVTSGALLGKKFELTTTLPKPYGSPDIEIRAFDGSTVLLAQSAIFDNVGGSLIAAGTWGANEVLEMERTAGGPLRLDKRPDTTLNTLAASDAAELFYRPMADKPVLLRRPEGTHWHVMHAGLAYDDAAKRMRQDVHHTLMLDVADSASATALKSANVWTRNSEWCEADGVECSYGRLAAAYLGAGIYDSSPSTCEPVARFGLMSDAFNSTFSGGPNNGKRKHELVGPGHNLIRLVPGTNAITMEVRDHSTGVWSTVSQLALPVGSSKLGRNLKFSATYDIFRLTQTGTARVGQVRYDHVFGHPDHAAGTYLEAEYKVGRTMTYTAQSIAVAEEVVITGGTSGATATVVLWPDTDTTGTIGAGDRAGEIFVKDATGTFQVGEPLKVGGIGGTTVALCGSVVGPEISCQDGYGHMLTATTVTMAKVNGQPAKVTGLEDAENDLYQAFTGGSRAQMWHPNRDVIYELLNLNASGVEAACPMTPPGNYSEAVDLQWSVQDRRDAGLRKFYNGWRSETVVRAIAGKFTARGVVRFRRGAPI